MNQQAICFGFVVILFPIWSCMPSADLKRSRILPSTREEFARAMDRIGEGMGGEQVVDILGKPDDVRTRNDPGGISIVGTKEIWRYGTSGHLTTATLGEIYLGKEGKVQYVFGKGTPPPIGLFEENQLRILLAILNQVPSYGASWGFNPHPLIRAVNVLQSLGKERSLAAIAEYLRVTSSFDDNGREGTFLVMRTLFEVPEDTGYLPRMFVGAPEPAEPKDPRLLPHFPLAIEGDIPFLLVSGYMLAGVPQPPEEHVKYFREHGKLRARPLVPTDRPLEALEKLAQSPQWIYRDAGGLWDDERGRHHLGEQILRLISSVYRPESDSRYFDILLPWGPEGTERRRKILEDVASLKIRWDQSRNQFVFLDGSDLPEPQKRLYRREYWVPTGVGRQLELAIERVNQRLVRIDLEESWLPGTKDFSGQIRIFEEGSPGQPLAKFEIGRRPTPTDTCPWDRGTRKSSQTIELPEGRALQTELGLPTSTKPNFSGFRAPFSGLT